MKQSNTSLFSGLLLRQKFLLLGLIALILVGTAFYAFVTGQQEKINVTVREQQGLAPAKELLTLVQVLPRHRGSSTGLLSGNAAMATEEKTTKGLADQHIAAFDRMAKSIADPELLKVWESIKQNWPKIAQDVDSRAVTPPQNFQAHTQLIAQVLEILDLLIDYYGLSLDPSAESYFLMRATLVDTPILTEYLGQARGWGTGLLAKAAKQAAAKKKDEAAEQNVVTLQDRGRLGLMTSISNAHLYAAKRDYGKFIKHNQGLPTSLGEQLKTASTLVDQAIQLSEKEIIAKTTPDYPSTDYYKQYTQAIDATFKVMDTGFTDLDTLFTRQIASATQKLWLISAIIIGLIMVCAFVTVYITRSITRPIGILVDVMQKLASGDSTVRANLQTFDEIGLLGRQFDMMVDQREAVSSKIQEENETLNNSVIDLLQAVAKLAQKDLTAKAIVAEDVTGPVSDALNLLADETAKVLNQVVQIADKVATISWQVHSQSDKIIDVAEDEKREIEQAAVELVQTSDAMLDIAKLAFSCNEAAEKAIKNTDKAQETVLGTVQGITTIRDTIRETEKRIKRLGERSQEIGGVVSLINEISERTHILALNASMHAASAGEAGRGFAVVANEVQKLAENSREATSKIAALVNNIQVETAGTIVTMNEAISQVVRGTDLAQQAGSEMRETRDTTADLVLLVQRISDSSTTQSEISLRLLQRAAQIQKSTEQTYLQLQEQGLYTEQLVELSNSLVTSVDVFTLPNALA